MPSPTGNKNLFSDFRELLIFVDRTEVTNSLGICTHTSETVRFTVRAKVDVRVQAVTLQVQQSAATTQGYYAYFRYCSSKTVETNDLLRWRGRLYKVGGAVFGVHGEFVQISIEQEERADAP